MKHLRYILEFLLLLPTLAMFRILSFRPAVWLARRLADIWYVLNIRRRRISIANIMACGITTDRTEASRIARESFRHVGTLLIESLKSRTLFARPDVAERMKLCVAPELEKLLKDPGQGIILATGHFGSFEIAAQLLSRGKPVAGVSRGMNNPYVNKIMLRERPKDGFYLMPKHDSSDTSRFLRVLKEGHVLALMVDQYAIDRGMMVEFFGRPASTHSGIAMLHLISGAPLCFGYCIRIGEMRYELHAEGPFTYKPTGNKEEDVRRVLKELNGRLEAAIRLAPEQYLWAHRRWR
ncbi:MAG: hypothetical protein E4H02_06760 [Lentisphaerales bacterium]|jgi:KDO2-lipid IV(A) lauroyltransferase|nr:MAG: hypothetical protein E4H02_06760 [Lentisphaerales bacterium]